MPEGTPPAAVPETETPNTVQPDQPAQAEQVAQPQEQAQTQPIVNLHGFTEEQLADMEKFYASQGGYEKVKSRISNPQNYQQPQQQPQQQPYQPQGQYQQHVPQIVQAEPAKLPDGYISQKEMNVARYFRDIAQEEKYSPLADDINSGAIIKDMAKLGLIPVDQDGNVNDAQIRQYMDLRAAAIPAPQPSTPVSGTAPTVDFTEIGENITSMDQALQVMRESTEAKARGLAPHPAYQKAEEYLKNNFGKH